MKLPPWALALLVLACLAGAAAMFWADAREDDSAPPKASAPDKELAEPELQVPEDDDEADTDGRRGDAGRDRLDEGRDSPAGEIDDPADADDDAADEDEPETQPLPPVFENLAGRTIAIFPASLDAREGGDELVRIGGLRVPCAAIGEPERLALELAQLRALGDVLERAGARTTVASPEMLAGRGSCVDARVQQLEDAELALVVRVVGREPRVLAGRPATNASAASKRASAAFAAELAGALGVDAPATPDAASNTRLAESAAIDLDGGARVAFVELADEGDVEEQAMAIARAMALSAPRAA